MKSFLKRVSISSNLIALPLLNNTEINQGYRGAHVLSLHPSLFQLNIENDTEE